MALTQFKTRPLDLLFIAKNGPQTLWIATPLSDDVGNGRRHA
jgi:hypothetical protein